MLIVAIIPGYHQITIICGRIDAKCFRKNEIFSIGSIISATTYTVDIVSGLCRL